MAYMRLHFKEDKKIKKKDPWERFTFQKHLHRYGYSHGSSRHGFIYVGQAFPLIPINKPGANQDSEVGLPDVSWLLAEAMVSSWGTV